MFGPVCFALYLQLTTVLDQNLMSVNVCPETGVLEDKSSSSKILEDNSEVMGPGLGLDIRVLGLGLAS